MAQAAPAAPAVKYPADRESPHGPETTMPAELIQKAPAMPPAPAPQRRPTIEEMIAFDFGNQDSVPSALGGGE
ncbi:hypothetical protein G7Z17_g235 [Cylindrodendrum hubeiense]|uniref:Uncharacterized protein n=1 Tax=Cylindrodendrum hubeiense TaxID=595255 RepID=A0A9P5LGE0_9HYPO|nr:hypothetical protein G7Z17_g235 [Cylindrodendrum hubeiense]